MHDRLEKNCRDLLLFPARTRPCNRGRAMRITLVAALLSAGTAGLCQSGTPRPAMPEQQVLPPITILPFNSVPREFHLNPDIPRGSILQEKPERGRGPRIDPGMVVHPPRASIGEQAPGTPVAQNLYPGLQLLPIDGLKAKVEPISIIWPNMKVENIPTTCPDCKMVLMETGTTAKPAGK